MSTIRAIIPAAGIGKRMQPLTHTKPKVLLPLAGKPIIGHLISNLVNIGINDITVVIGYFGEKVEEYCLREYPDTNFKFCWQHDRLGLGHAVGKAISDSDKKLLIVLGDTLFRGDLANFNGETAILGVVKVEDPSRFGVAVVENGFITNLEEKPEKPKSNLALAGIYYLPDAQVLKRSIDHIVDNDIKTRDEYQITDALEHMINSGELVNPLEIDGWYDCGIPETLIETNRALFDRKMELNSVIDRLREFNTIIDPVFIDKSADVRFSVIGPYVHIGADCKIINSYLSNTIIDNNSVLNRQILEETIVGSNAVVSSNSKKLMIGDNCVLED
jgi:glucose-1-phosphate thymidylyltransferase